MNHTAYHNSLRVLTRTARDDLFVQSVAIWAAYPGSAQSTADTLASRPYGRELWFLDQFRTLYVNLITPVIADDPDRSFRLIKSIRWSQNREAPHDWKQTGPRMINTSLRSLIRRYGHERDYHSRDGSVKKNDREELRAILQTLGVFG